MDTHTPYPLSASPPSLEPEIERELLRAYIDSANDGIFVVCDEMKFHVANPLMATWIGISETELTAHGQRMPITELLGPTETEALFREHFRTALEGRATRFEMEINPPRGEPRWVEISMNRVRLNNGELVIGILRDVTERRMLQTTLQHHVSHDDLTGLVNRREFQQRLQALVDSVKTNRGSHVLAYIDLDQFKLVNDTCGHLAGDELLRLLGQQLKQLTNRRDVVARLGGDEFGLLLYDRPIEEGMRVAEALRTAMAGYRFAWDGRSFEVTASVGLCAVGDDTVSAEDALSAADAACYVAKDQGRNRVQLYLGGTACTGRRQEMQWVARLQKALDENRFQIWQQQILDLRRAPGEGAGHVEMLLRLIGEDGAIVAPDRFFPAAERYGLMPAIDRWVVQHLLLDEQHGGLQAEMARTSATHCAINLSGASLNDDMFMAFLEDALRRTTLAGDRLCFEITETVAVTHFGRTREVMHAIKQFGCRFALDDFGSGMSSFSYLKNLPVDYLKIDGTLVRHIVEDAADFAMVEAINRVGAALGLKTIAEFVESEAALRRLREIGVDYAQGYAIHRPQPLFGESGPA
ncbi:putative bifunctional diguanylate cyclase/phosphodiesterase [Thiobacillus denitrificans]|uniref:putative bifunctional diguanylate cyclase/phosphodiesterase n=1 Tax=Thiobacillus denitrificans TaxID=36861 RepID=UPI00039AF87E|nr:EAL domain-containing protein [Thiobacillus denitrificans]